MKQTLIVAWVAVLFLMLVGAGSLCSPAFIDGGILNLLSPASHDNWLGYLLNIAFSVVFGLLILGLGVGLAFAVGITTTAIVVTQKGQQPPSGVPLPATKLPLANSASVNQSRWPIMIVAGFLLVLLGAGVIVAINQPPKRNMPPGGVMNHPNPAAQEESHSAPARGQAQKQPEPSTQDSPVK